MSKPIEKFRKKHGRWVPLPKSNMLLFEDGAQCEDSSGGIGVMLEPPEDAWERAKLIGTFWEIKATTTEQEFYDFKSYLNGNGVCPEGIHTPEEKLTHLRKLKSKATAARTRYRKARKEVEETTPFWLLQKRKLEARERRVREQFHEEVNSIEL